MKNVRIDIVSDVVCPWCIIGYRRLEKALDMLADQIQANIHWHPFELNPHMPQGGENLRSHLAGKYGTTLEGSIKARAYESSFVVNGGEEGKRPGLLLKTFISLRKNSLKFRKLCFCFLLTT